MTASDSVCAHELNVKGKEKARDCERTITNLVNLGWHFVSPSLTKFIRYFIETYMEQNEDEVTEKKRENKIYIYELLQLQNRGIEKYILICLHD